MGVDGAADLRARTGGSGEPVLLLLHGLGATADVWDSAVLDREWSGRWVAPDLPGHGRSAPLPRYSFGALAAAVATAADHDGPVTVVGHSLGGVVALALASGWFGMQVETAAAVGIKVSWSEEELAKSSALARRPVTWFPDRDAAAERHLRVSGLAGLVDPTDAAVDGGLVEREGQWRLALDPRAFAVGAPDMAGLLAASRARRMVLARGEHDPMVLHTQLSKLGPDSVTLPGLGHNAHVEDLSAVLGLLEARS